MENVFVASVGGLFLVYRASVKFCYYALLVKFLLMSVLSLGMMFLFLLWMVLMVILMFMCEFMMEGVLFVGVRERTSICRTDSTSSSFKK